MYNTRVATCAPARKSQLTQATHKTVGTILLAIARSPSLATHARAWWDDELPRCPTFAHTGQMSADILARFYGLIFFSAIFIVAAVRVVISRRSQTSPAVLPVSRA